MSRLQKAVYAFTGFVMIIFGLLMYLTEGTGYLIILLVLEFALMIFGLQQLIYYFTMARFMVGGKILLFIGIFLLDVGSFSMTVLDESRYTVLLYLIAWHGFIALVKVLRAIEAKRNKASSWRMNALNGALNLLIALSSLACIHNLTMLSYLYSFGLICSGVMRIASSFRKTSIVYIQ